MTQNLWEDMSGHRSRSFLSFQLNRPRSNISSRFLGAAGLGTMLKGNLEYVLLATWDLYLGRLLKMQLPRLQTSIWWDGRGAQMVKSLHFHTHICEQLCLVIQRALLFACPQP